MAVHSYARPEGNPHRRVSDIVIESLEKRLDLAKTTGFALGSVLFLLWMGTMFLWAKYPWLLSGLGHLQRRICE